MTPVEIFSFSEYGWRPASFAEEVNGLSQMSLVQGEDTVVVAGGYNGGYLSRKLYTYDPTEETGWRTEINEMTYPRRYFVALRFPDESIQCN